MAGMSKKSFYWIPIKATCPACKVDAIGEAGGEIEPSRINELLAMAALTPLVCPKCHHPVPETVRRATFPQVVSEEKFRSRNLHNKQTLRVTKIPDEVN
jgi:hypothetical protein